MLPSTGYFKGIICPFNDNGLCERPYCHYRHLDLDESGAILQKLVSAAVIKALQQSDTSGVKPLARVTQGDTTTVTSTSTVTSSVKATYNPTPISELNKINSTDTENLEDSNEQRRRHIPVPYTPRKPAGFLPLKRPVDVHDPKPFIYNPPGPPVKYKPGSAENTQNDKYTPPGAVESKEKYLPGTEKELQEYTPDTNSQDSPTKLNYVPSSDKNGNKKKILEYKPAKVATKTGKPLVTYQPTPRSLAPCFSSDEEEPETKKMKLSSDLNGFDDLGPEFDILGQILDEEETSEKVKGNDKDHIEKLDKSSKLSKNNNREICNTEKDKSQHKSKSEIDKSSDEQKNISKSEKKLSQDNHKSRSDRKSTDSKEKRKSSDDRHKSKSEKNSDDNHKNKSDRKSTDEIHKIKSDKKSSDVNYKVKSDKKTENIHKSKSEKKYDDKHKSHSEKKSDEHHRSHSDKKSNENHKSKSDKEKDEKHKKEKEHKKSNHKSSSKEREKDKNNIEKHSNDKKHSSKSCQNPKHSSSTKSEKHSQSRNSNISKSKDSSSSKEKHHKKSKTKDRHRSEDKLLDSSDHEHGDTEDNGVAEEDYDLSDADDDAIALECKRIFEEYVPIEKPKNPDENLMIDNLTEEDYIPGKKRVSRTIDKNIKITPRAPIKPDFKVSAANTMAERLVKVREFHSSRNIQSSTNKNPPITNENSPKIELQKPAFSTPSINSSKIRIAHVPYASTMLNTKKTILPSQPAGKIQASSSTTISQTVSKGAQRVAHIPSEKFIDRPGVLEPLASKIPANIRSIYLNMMIDECLKLYLSTHDAYARAQHEELNTSKKCSTVPIYKNSAVLAVSRLRKELVECNGVKKSGPDCSTGKPDSSLRAMNSGSWSIESKNRKVYDNSHEFSGAKFYENIKKWVLTEEQLQENSFPRPHESGQKGRAVIYGQNKQNPPKGYIRTCCRCKKEYTVDKKGFSVVKEECIYHPNRKYRVRGEARYQCCSQDGSSDGCCIAPSHVYEYVDFENLKGYVRTLPPERQMDDYGVYSLDCEMCYTTNGLDLTRVTVINSSCKVVYETLIKPLHPIIDYNTRYSGITEEQMADVKTTLLEVQATLLAIFNSKTILVGHSLESDFKALKLIHDTVIDTSVLFPHKMGPPFKRALRNLSSEYLKKIIQNSVEGHDSAEDAMVCMELLQYKLKEDLKTR